MKPETRALLEKAKQSLAAAMNLERDGFLDFSASRAYYSLFYTAEALLFEKGQSYSSHAGVISAFGKTFAKEGIIEPRFHRYLLDGQDTRNVGDYGIGPAISLTQAEEMIGWAREFIETAEMVLRESTGTGSSKV